MRQPSMLSVGFEPIISAIKWLQTYNLDCIATGINLLCDIRSSILNGLYKMRWCGTTTVVWIGAVLFVKKCLWQ